jgi:hypothetical protein
MRARASSSSSLKICNGSCFMIDDVIDDSYIDLMVGVKFENCEG